jgi:hypothetical protein
MCDLLTINIVASLDHDQCHAFDKCEKRERETESQFMGKNGSEKAKKHVHHISC